MDYLLAFISLGIIASTWFVVGLFNDRKNKLQDELDEWSGIYDVKREVDNKLANDNERKRLRDKYNQK